MRDAKSLWTYPILLAAVLALGGCGGGPETDSELDKVLEEARIQPTPTITPEPEPVNFGSFPDFPMISIEVSDDLAPDGDKRYPLLEGKTIENATGETIPNYWAATAPATCEITLPPDARIHRVEIMTSGSATGFQECALYLKTSEDSEWERPPNVSLAQPMTEKDEHGYCLRYSFEFDETPAAKILFGIRKGGGQNPDTVYVRDIDVFGFQ